MRFFRQHREGIVWSLLALGVCVAAYFFVLLVTRAILDGFAAAQGAALHAIASSLTQPPTGFKVLLHLGAFVSFPVAVCAATFLSEHAGRDEHWGVNSVPDALFLGALVVVGLPWLVVFFALAMLISLPFWLDRETPS